MRTKSTIACASILFLVGAITILVASLDLSTDGQSRRRTAVSDAELDGVFGGHGGHCTNGKVCQWDGTSGCAGSVSACTAVWIDHWLGGYWEAAGLYIDGGCEVDNQECVDGGDPDNDQCTIVSGGCPGSTYSYECELDYDYDPPHAVKNPDTKTEVQCQDTGWYHSDGCDLGHG